MAATSRVQINFERLLNVCENQAASSATEDRWRLQKYVEDLQCRLTDLEKLSCNKPHPEVLKDFRNRVDLLKGVLNAEKLETVSEKVLATHTLPVPRQVSSSNQELSTPSQSKEILLHTKAKFSNQSRRALLGDQGDGLRQRGGVSSEPESDLDAVIQFQQQRQEKLAEEMVQLARNMKDHAHAASQIVKDDTKKLADANKLADSNYKQLKLESARLEEHTKKSSWWLLLLVMFVVMIFIWMIIFMKIFPKPRT